MQYQIKRKTGGADLIVATITPTGNQQREAMGVDIVDMAFALPNYVAFKLGDFVEVYGQVYKLNTSPTEEKISGRNYSYNLQFQAIFYDLAKVQMQTLNPQNQLLEPVFDLTGNAATIIGLIVENALRYSAGWAVGVVDETDYQTFSFNAQNCLQALHELASRFQAEFWIDNKTIHLQKREQTSGLIFEYGQGNGLYTVTRKEKEGAKLLTRLYVRGGSTNIPANYGSTSLLLPNGETYIQDDAKADPAQGGELIEATQVFTDIFPTRTGTITSVVTGDDNWKYFYDTSLDFDINEHLAAGLEAKVHFVDGDLAGYTFTIANYDHATKRFTINKNEDETALDIPSNTLRPRAGNKYRLIDFNLPQPYVTDAENRLLAAAQEYYNQNSDVANLNQYSATVDRMFVKNNAVVVALGNTAILQDGDMNFTTELRISKYTRNLQDAYDYPEVTWSDKIAANEIIRQYQQQQKTILLLESSGLLSVDQMRKNLFLNRLSANNGYLMLGSEKVKAGIADYAPNAGHALLASEAINSTLWNSKAFDDYLNQAVKTNSDVVHKSLTSPNFVSGVLGSGFRIDENGNAEVDNLVVRKSFSVTEFVLQKVRASNGAIAVTDSMTVKSVVELSAYIYKCLIETDGGNIAPSFAVNDLVRSQVFNGSSSKYIFGRVTAVGADYFTILLENATAAPSDGDTFIRVGNTTDANRQGLIYMTNADSGAPFIDVLDGVNTESFAARTKVRLGKLDGIVDADLGALSGYGIYTQNGFFKGKVHITGGNGQTIAGSQALANAAQANAVAAASSDATSKANAAQAAAQNHADAQAAYEREIAKAYADGIVSDEEARAIADANTKLQAAKDDATAKANAAQAAAISAASSDATIKANAALTTAASDATAKQLAAEANAQAMVNAVKVGGKNLVKDSKLTLSGTGQIKVYYLSEPLKVGETYTATLNGISGIGAVFQLWVDWANQMAVRLNKNDGIDTVSATFIYNGADAENRVSVWSENSVNASTVQWIKIEVGTKATDWTPAPEDVDAAVSAAQSSANAAQAANTALTNSLKAMAYKDIVELAELGNTIIEGGKLKNVLVDTVFLKANVANVEHINGLDLTFTEATINNIKARTINAAEIIVSGGGATQAYAQSVANAAQSAATAAASSDATSKANAAQAAAQNHADAQAAYEREIAKAYADGIVSDEEARAIADANTKLQAAKDDATAKANAAQAAAISAASSDATIKANAVLTAAASDATAKQLAAEANAQAMVNAVKVGGRNFVKNSKQTISGTGQLQTYWLSEPLKIGETYTATLNGISGVGAAFRVWVSYASHAAVRLNKNDGVDTVSASFVYNGVADEYRVTVYSEQSVNPSTVHWIKIEVGNKATDWTPAPEDVDAAVSAAQTAATNAQAANAALTASLKTMAYKDVVQLAELGNTIIEGGKIKTTLLDAAAIKANIINADYLNSLEIVTKNLKTAATGKRVEIDSTENNIRLFDIAGEEILGIDDDVAFEYTRIRPDGVGGIEFIDYYGPGVRVGQATGRSGSLSRYGFALKGEDSKEAFRVGFGWDRRGIIIATGSDPDPLSYYHEEQITYYGITDIFDLRKADGGTVKLTFINGLLARVGNPTVLKFMNNVIGSATVEFAPCDVGEVGTKHTRTVAIGTVKGTSQADANNKANAQALALAQADAAAYGLCQLQEYRIQILINDFEVNYTVADINNEPIDLPVNVTLNFYVATSVNSGYNSAVSLPAGYSNGFVYYDGGHVIDFVVNSYNPTSHNSIPIYIS